jgi:hypothetical protein
VIRPTPVPGSRPGLGTNAGARALCEARGFVVDGVQRGELLLDGRYVDDVLMALSLDGAGPEVQEPGAGP